MNHDLPNWTFEFFRKKFEGVEQQQTAIVDRQSEILTTLQHIERRLHHMAVTLQELQDTITAQAEKIGLVESGLTDLAADQKAAFEALKAQIASGAQDLGPAMDALAASFPRLDAIVEAIKTSDTEAETISGQPTPPVA